MNVKEKIFELEKIGFKILKEYKRWSNLYVVVQDKNGYKYDAVANDLLQGHLSPIHKKNKYSLYNISLWLQLNNKDFELCQDNIYVDAHKNLKFYRPICGHYFYMNWNNICNNHSCSVCDGRQVNENTSFSYLKPDLSKEWDDDNDSRPEEYSIHSRKMVLWKCSKCGYKWKATIDSRTSMNSGCPACDGKIVTDRNRLSIIFPEISILWHPTKNGELTSNDVSYGLSRKVWWKCSICGWEWMARIYDRTTNKSGCPLCASSKGEDSLKIYFNKNKIEYSFQHRFLNCRNKLPLPFDFYLLNQNICIEYHGKQHYEPVEFFGGEETFKELKKRDKIKTKYCKDNHIKLIRIPYWDFDNIEKILSKELL